MSVLSTTSDDGQAIAQIRNGDAAGLERLYDQHSTAIYSLALRIVRDVAEAEDVTQEVFAQIWTRARSYDAGRGSVAAWMMVIARSRALDRLRRRRTGLQAGQPDHVVNDIPDPRPSVEVQAATDEQARAARLALAALPDVERTALELAYYEGLTQAEIAERTTAPLGTVKTRIRTALRRVREAMTTRESSIGREP